MTPDELIERGWGLTLEVLAALERKADHDELIEIACRGSEYITDPEAKERVLQSHIHILASSKLWGY